MLSVRIPLIKIPTRPEHADEVRRNPAALLGITDPLDEKACGEFRDIIRKVTDEVWMTLPPRQTSIIERVTCRRREGPLTKRGDSEREASASVDDGIEVENVLVLASTSTNALELIENGGVSESKEGNSKPAAEDEEDTRPSTDMRESGGVRSAQDLIAQYDREDRAFPVIVRLSIKSTWVYKLVELLLLATGTSMTVTVLRENCRSLCLELQVIAYCMLIIFAIIPRVLDCCVWSHRAVKMPEINPRTRQTVMSQSATSRLYLEWPPEKHGKTGKYRNRSIQVFFEPTTEDVVIPRPGSSDIKLIAAEENQHTAWYQEWQEAMIRGRRMRSTRAITITPKNWKAIVEGNLASAENRLQQNNLGYEEDLNRELLKACQTKVLEYTRKRREALVRRPIVQACLAITYQALVALTALGLVMAVFLLTTEHCINNKHNVCAFISFGPVVVVEFTVVFHAYGVCCFRKRVGRMKIKRQVLIEGVNDTFLGRVRLYLSRTWTFVTCRRAY